MEQGVSVGLVLGLAAFLDYAIGDPWGWLHPVQVIGAMIAVGRDRILDAVPGTRGRFWAGVGLGLGVIGSTGVITGAIAYLGFWLHPIIGLGLATILLASCWAGRSLRMAAEDVLAPLQRQELETARIHLSRYVGRETTHLDEAGILRAILETVSENGVDGALAPLFYTLVGASLDLYLATPGAILTIAFAMAYKAASTLDSMVGYKREPYRDLGRFSARLEDGLTWLPCRCGVLTIALLSRRPLDILRICWRDARHDASPNSGWSESAYAAWLGVQMGGPNCYQGVTIMKPLLGDAKVAITPERVRAALGLTRCCLLLWLAIALGGVAILKALGYLD